MNPSTSKLYQDSIKLFNGKLTDKGSLVVYSGLNTGRCPKAKRVITSENIWWSGTNISMNPELYKIYKKYARKIAKPYVIDAYAGWDESIKVRICCIDPYHALFMKNMLIPSEKQFDNPDFTIYNVGSISLESVCVPENIKDSTLSNTLIAINFEEKDMIIYGTNYAGEMKKGILSLMMFLMPIKNHLPLHSSANIDNDGNTTLFFGLSGTGKTTLSTDPNRYLIGDDEHVWTDKGIFNIEGGCYAKCSGLSQKSEPDIYNAIKYGSILENVIMNDDGSVNYNDISITENTRASYPLNFIEKVKIPAIGNHPNNIILLTCDAFGLLPPVAKLSVDQAIFMFINGYTSKTPGTEVGIKEPIATFSSCFGEPFIVWSPKKYGELLKEKLIKYKSKVWMVNTGYIGGSYNTGKRISINYSRAIINAIHDNHLNDFESFPYFNFEIPLYCPNIPNEILNPINSWNNKEEYNIQLEKLYDNFVENFNKKAL